MIDRPEPAGGAHRGGRAGAVGSRRVLEHQVGDVDGRADATRVGQCAHRVAEHHHRHIAALPCPGGGVEHGLRADLA